MMTAIRLAATDVHSGSCQEDRGAAPQIMVQPQVANVIAQKMTATPIRSETGRYTRRPGVRGGGAGGVR